MNSIGQPIGLKIGILKPSAEGQHVYDETHYVETSGSSTGSREADSWRTSGDTTFHPKHVSLLTLH